MENNEVAVQQSVIIIDMSADEARQKIGTINAQGEELRRLIWETYERNAHKSLGYKTWRDMAKSEFKMGQTAAYYTLNAARVERGIASLPDTEPSFSQLCKDLPESVFRPVMSIKDPHELRAIFQLAYATQRQLFEAGLVLNETPSDAVIDEARGVVEDIKLTEGHVNILGNMVAATSSVVHNWTERQQAHIKGKMGQEPPKQKQEQLVEMLIRYAGVKIVSTNGRNVTLMFDTDKDAKALRKLWQDNKQGLRLDLYTDKE